MRTDDLVGTEYDWVAVDPSGNIGVFSTAGYGPVPKAALCRTTDHESLIGWIGERAELPEFADIITFVGDVPIYGFDWEPHSGPYRRIQQPRGFLPMRLEALPEELRGAVVEIEASEVTGIGIILVADIDRIGTVIHGRFQHRVVTRRTNQFHTLHLAVVTMPNRRGG